jgi:signal recognition particle receptor subunit beta
MSVRQLNTGAVSTAAETRRALDVIAHAQRALTEVGEAGASVAVAGLVPSLTAPQVTIVVAGEYQQGKSSLVNALLGARVVPVEPMAATASPTRIAAGPAVDLAARVAVDDAHGARFEEVALSNDRFTRLACDPRPAVEGDPVVLFDVHLPHALLAAGLSIVDTPGLRGGLGSPAAAVVLGLAQTADALVFVTDASQELTGPEADFLRAAHTLCPRLVVALTKIDLHREWRRILDLDRHHIGAIAPDAVVVPVSPVLRQASVRLGDEQLDRESGLPLLGWYLAVEVMTEARRAAIERVSDSLDFALAGAVARAESRLGVATEATGQRELEARYQSARGRIEALQGRWRRKLSYELASFRDDTSYDLSAQFDAVLAQAEGWISSTDPGDAWPEIERRVHIATNEAITVHLAHIRDRAHPVTGSLSRFLELQSDVLTAEIDLAGAQELTVAADFEEPAFDDTRRGRRFDVWRNSLSAGGLGLGVALKLPLIVGITTLVAPVAALVGVGATAGAASMLLRRNRVSELDARRRLARVACHDYLSAVQRVVARSAAEIRTQLQFQIEEQVESRLTQLHADTERELRELTRLRDLATEHVPAELAELAARIEQLRIVHGHARQLRHRVARTTIAAVGT